MYLKKYLAVHWIVNNTPDEKEQEMIDSQWKIIKLKHQFQSYEQKQVQPCGRCFVELALIGEL